tara:strand:- start:220 stop:1065 length:846 start_codon:yes stop_codon:yes gene_type:complete
MAELLDDIKEPELPLEEGESAGDILEDNPEPAPQDIAEEGAVASDVSNLSVDPDTEEDLPEKYRGKGTKEIIEMHRELERRMSEQGNEVSNLRSTLDAMALNAPASEPESEPITEADFFSDPTNTVNRAIDNHPALRQAQEMAQKMAYAQGLATLQQRHPDLQDVVSSEGFKEWVKASNSRMSRYTKADQMGDVEEADDLISTYKQLNKVTATAKEASKKAQKQAVSNANTGSTRGNSDVRGSRRVYRSADIRQLMMTDPKRYEDLQPEIMQAYAEGRVRD